MWCVCSDFVLSFLSLNKRVGFSCVPFRAVNLAQKHALNYFLFSLKLLIQIYKMKLGVCLPVESLWRLNSMKSTIELMLSNFFRCDMKKGNLNQVQFSCSNFCRNVASIDYNWVEVDLNVDKRSPIYHLWFVFVVSQCKYSTKCSVLLNDFRLVFF